MVQMFLLSLGNRAVRASVCLHFVNAHFIAKFTKKTYIALMYLQDMYNVQCRRFFVVRVSFV